MRTQNERRVSTAAAFILLLLLHASPTCGVRLGDKLLLSSSPDEESHHVGLDEPAELSSENLSSATDDVPAALQGEAASTQPTQQEDTHLESSPDENERIYIEIKTVGHIRAVSATMKGRRPTDEDEATTLEQLNSNTYFMGLFDGHGGSETARYLRENAHKTLAEAIDAQVDTPIDFDEKKIAEACIELDKRIVTSGICKDSGSTAAMLIVERDILAAGSFKLHAIYVGDSRILVLNFDGAPLTLTEDHKPNRPEEAARIRAAGGEVYNIQGVWRVGGTLAISRAFGDQVFKDYASRPATEQQVVAVPGQQTKDVSARSLLLLACDGLFETVNTDLEDVLKAALEESGGGIVNAVRKLLLTAYDRGSGDNISVIVAMMHPEPAPPSSRRLVLGRDDEL